jgi:hypothetical protein
VLELASGAARRPRDAERDEALRALEAWMARDWSHRSSGLDVTDTPLRRRVRRALEEAVRTAPRHRRAEILRAAATVRDALTRPLPLGVERALGALADERPILSPWLAMAAALVTRAPVGSIAPSERGPPDWRVLILLGREIDE